MSVFVAGAKDVSVTVTLNEKQFAQVIHALTHENDARELRKLEPIAVEQFIANRMQQSTQITNRCYACKQSQADTLIKAFNASTTEQKKELLDRVK